MRVGLPFPQLLRYEREQRGWSQAELASRIGIDTKTVNRWESGKRLPRLYYRQKLSELFQKSMEEFGLNGESTSSSGTHQADWGESPQVEVVYGRAEESQLLKQWVVDDACRIVSVLGLGGMGKTTLVSYLVGQIKDEFDSIFWRSVQHAPSLEHILKKALQFFSTQQKSTFPTSLDDQISLLIHYLQDHRCLFILDNFESLLQPGQHVGHYREGYESYGVLLQRLGEVQHTSCLLVTSREKPREIARMEGVAKAVRTLHLSGIAQIAGRALLHEKRVYGSDEQWEQLIARYGGNPLALKLASEYIEGIFGGSIDLFLAEDETSFGDVNELMEQQFRRLATQEQEVLFWLAIEREGIGLESLRETFARPVSRGALLEALHSLQRRSLIETRDPAQFTLQPVIMEYVTDKLVKQAYEEFQAQAAPLWTNYAFMKAGAPNYIRENQLRFILRPLAEYLQATDTREGLLEKLKQMISASKEMHILRQGYLAGNVLNLLSAMQYDIRDTDFSSLAIWQAHLQGVSLVDVNFAHTSFKNSVFTNTFGNILSVTFSLQHDLLAVGSATGEIGIYQMPDAQLLHTFHDHTDGVWSLAFSTDSQLLASSSDDGTIRVWNMHTQECSKVLHGHTNRVRCIAFNSDGTLLVSGSDDQTVGLWNIRTGQSQHIFYGHTNRVWAVAFYPHENILVSGSTDTSIRLWDIATGQCLRILRGHTHNIRSLAFSSDGSLLASGSDDQTVFIWNTHTNYSKIELYGHTNRVWSVAFHPNGTLLASGGEDATVRLWNAHTGQVVNILQNHTHGVRSVAFSPNGEVLASGGDDQSICLWSVESGFCLKKMQGYTNRVWSIAFGADLSMLVSGSEDHAIRLWNTKTGQTRYAVVDHNHAVRSIAVSPDGTTLASGGQDQKIWLWHMSTGSRVKALQGHTNWVWSVAFHPDGQILASGSEDSTIRLWQVSTGRTLRTLEGHSSWVRSIAFSNTGQVLASGSDDQTVKLWDVSTGFCICTLQGHTHRVRSVAFSPDGQILASSSEDQTVRLWSVTTQETLYRLEGHTSWVRSVSFSPDNQLLASGGEDSRLRLWNVSTGECIAILDGHTNRIRSINFSVDGTLLASGSDDGTILLWHLATRQCIMSLMSDKPYERMNISHASGLTEGQKAALKALGAIEE